MRMFLRMSPGNVFVLTFGLGFALDCLWFIFTILHLPLSTELYLFSEVAGLFCFACYCAWSYAVGTSLFDSLPPDQATDKKTFLGFWWSVLIAGSISHGLDVVQYVSEELAWIIAGYSAAITYGILFLFLAFTLAKGLVLAEKSKFPTFGNYLGEWVAFFIHPVGVWWLQVRIVAIFTGTDSHARNRYKPLDQF